MQVGIRLARGRYAATPVACDHGQNAVQQVAQVVGQVVRVAAQERLARELAVLAERHFPQHIVAQRVHSPIPPAACFGHDGLQHRSGTGHGGAS